MKELLIAGGGRRDLAGDGGATRVIPLLGENAVQSDLRRNSSATENARRGLLMDVRREVSMMAKEG